MIDQLTIQASTAASSRTASANDFERLDSHAQRQSYRTLAVAAFIYAGVYLSAFFVYWSLDMIQLGGFCPPEWDTLAFASGSILVAVIVGKASWKGKMPARRFSLMARLFLVVSALGISANLWGWESQATDPDEHLLGVPWVGVWIIMFPTVVSLDPRCILRTSVAAALTMPAIIYASLFLNGAPDPNVNLLPVAWRWTMVLGLPVLICIGIAFVTAFRTFKMAHDATKARRMGSYHLTEKLGVGGMGEVWRAEHRLLARPAAIKVIRREALTGDGSDGSSARTALRRFEREAQATAMLTSPHTVQLYDFGTTNDGSFYYVMELLEGMDLKSLVETSGPVPQERAIHFLRQASDSLADAHQSGLIHRDVKPANIFTCRRGLDFDYVKVLDFGLVKETGYSGEAATQLTMQGLASGTPAFMSPEMIAGDRELDGRADLYALGCVGYWLLTGELVFLGDTAMAVILQHAKEDPSPMSTRSEMEIDPELESAIMACLAKDPDDRPASARDLAVRLAEIEKRLGCWSQERAERWWKNHLPQYATAIASRPTPIASVVPAT